MIQLDKREAFPFSSNPFGLVYENAIINLLQLNDYSFEPLLSNEQLYLIGDIKLTY